MSAVAVYGAGAFGTALAISLARDGRDVTLVARDPDHAARMASARENAARLPGHVFPPGLEPVAALRQAPPVCLVAVPMQQLADFAARNADALAGRALVACCKGVDMLSGRGATSILAETVAGCHPAILSGPSFAVDIAAGLPTALTLASRDAGVTESLQRDLSTANLRLYRNGDVTGVELGGALKNVIAIAAGVAIGAELGESARASVITRGYAEMRRFAESRGALPDTLSGLSGFGDLVLTCTSEKSRNYAYGLAIGRGLPRPIGTTVEGAATAKAVSVQAKSGNLDMPICHVVAALVDERLGVREAIDMLLSRPLKEE